MNVFNGMYMFYNVHMKWKKNEPQCNLLTFYLALVVLTVPLSLSACQTQQNVNLYFLLAFLINSFVKVPVGVVSCNQDVKDQKAKS